MISISHKTSFLILLLQRNLVSDPRLQVFIRRLINQHDLLKRVHFIKHDDHHHRHLLIIDLQAAQPHIWINDRVYRDTRLLKSFLRILQRTSGELYILFETHNYLVQDKPKLAQEFHMIQHMLFELDMELLIRDYRCSELKKQLDQALDDHDERRFRELSLRYVNLLGGDH